MRYKPGDVVRAVMRIRDNKGDVAKGDLCIVRASFATSIARDWDDNLTRSGGVFNPAAAKRRSRIVMCSVIHLRGGSNMLIPEVQLEPVGKNDDDDTTTD